MIMGGPRNLYLNEVKDKLKVLQLVASFKNSLGRIAENDRACMRHVILEESN